MGPAGNLCGQFRLFARRGGWEAYNFRNNVPGGAHNILELIT
jgi:hypothetical protein